MARLHTYPPIYWTGASAEPEKEPTSGWMLPPLLMFRKSRHSMTDGPEVEAMKYLKESPFLAALATRLSHSACKISNAKQRSQSRVYTYVPVPNLTLSGGEREGAKSPSYGMPRPVSGFSVARDIGKQSIYSRHRLWVLLAQGRLFAGLLCGDQDPLLTSWPLVEPHFPQLPYACCPSRSFSLRFSHLSG